MGYYKDRGTDDTKGDALKKLKGGILEIVQPPSGIAWIPEKVLDPQIPNRFKPEIDGVKKGMLQNIPTLFNQVIGRVDAFWHQLIRQDGANMSKPSDSSLKKFLQGFFEYAGGIYVTSGMTERRANRVSFTNTQGMQMHGPFLKTKPLAACRGMEDLANWLATFTTFNEASTVEALAAVANQIGDDVGDYYFIGIKSMADLNRKGLKAKVNLPWQELKELTELTQLNGELILGHPTKFEQPTIFDYIFKTYINPSQKQYAAVDIDDKLRIDYFIQDPEDDKQDNDEDENKQLVGQPVDTEKLQELLQRYDLKSYDIDAPKTQKYTPLTLTTTNGSVVEIKALRDAAIKEYESVNLKPLKTSSKTIYGLEVPSRFNVTSNSFSIRVGAEGITTTIGESTLKLLPPDRQFTLNIGMEAIGTPSINPRLKASQRNFLGL